MTGKCWSELKIFIYLREQLCLFFRKINFHMANTYGNTFNLTFLYIFKLDPSACVLRVCVVSPWEPFKEFSAVDAHPGWHPITSNAHHFHTILARDLENFF
jgi:hypothetical protein